MVLKLQYCFLALLLCIPLIFAGCEKSPEKVPAESLLSQGSETNSESEEIETEEITESVASEPEKIETEEITESVASESEVTESKESSSAEEIQGDGTWPSLGYDLDQYTGVLVRWGSVIGDRYHPYFPDPFEVHPDPIYGNSDKDMSKLIMVNVELLDVVDHKALHGNDWKIEDLDKIFVPPQALDNIVEGSESLVFIDVESYDHLWEKWGLVGVIEPPSPSYVPLPIFRYENGRMLIDDAQLMKTVPLSPDCWVYAMPFLRRTQLIDIWLRRDGADEKYYFRSGMTIDELEEYYHQVSIYGQK